jgi:hypothetical protein
MGKTKEENEKRKNKGQNKRRKIKLPTEGRNKKEKTKRAKKQKYQPKEKGKEKTEGKINENQPDPSPARACGATLHEIVVEVTNMIPESGHSVLPRIMLAPSPCLYLSILSPARPGPQARPATGLPTNLTGRAWAEISKPAKKKFSPSPVQNAVFSCFIL